MDLKNKVAVFRVKLLTTAILFNHNNMFGVAVDRH